MNEEPRNEETQKDKRLLLEEIRKKSEAEAREIVEEARKTAEQKQAAAEAQDERIRKEARKRAEARADSIRETKLANLAMQKRRVHLHQNEEIMQLVIGRTAETIETMVDTPEYVRALEEWTVEACLGLGTEAAVLETSGAERKYFDPPAIERIRKTVQERGGPRMELSLSENTADDVGIVARSPDGRLVYDNLVGTRLRRNKNRLRKLIHQELIEKGTL
jgi:vacuolar-type H+-ATPase subunit E/Vma4